MSDLDYTDRLESANRELRAALSQMQENLWSDLAIAIHDAHNGVWSVGIENKIYRIVSVAKLTGTTHWGAVAIPLIVNGVYDAIVTRFDLEHDPGYQLEVLGSWRSYEKDNIKETAKRILEMPLEAT